VKIIHGLFYSLSILLGSISTASSIDILPETAVPVTTVPNPFNVKTLSIGSLKRPFVG